MNTNRIVGGSPTTIEEVPWIVSIQRYGAHHCGASIISITRLLTAAHCTIRVPTNGLIIRAGSTYYEFGGQHVQVLQVFNHPQYSESTLDNDISILWIQALKLDASVRQIRLPSQGQGLAVGVQAHVAGWGNICENCIHSPILRYIYVPILSQAECNKLYGGLITTNMFCAGFLEGGRDTCQRDSGGPLVVDGIQYGVVSWGNGCARPMFPGVYANVSQYRNWINSVL